MPTDIANKSAIITSIIDGGIKIPKVPDAAIVPVARDLSYFLSNITGNANSVIITTDAPIIPVVAAIIVPIIVTDKAKPPGTDLNKICSAYISLLQHQIFLTCTHKNKHRNCN